MAQEFAAPTTSTAEQAAKPEVGIDIAIDGNRPEVQVRGEIDLSNATALRDQLLALRARDSDVVVDLSGVDFMGVAGLEALCTVARQFAESDDRLLVRSPPAMTRRVIDVLGLNGLLPIIAEEPLTPT